MPEFPGRLRTPRLTSAPGTPAVGELYYNTADNTLYWWNGTAWQAARSAVSIFRTGHTWAVDGDVPAGTLPPIFIPEAAGQVTTLVGVRAMLGGGTSVTAQIQRNGTNLGAAISVTPTAATTAFSQALADLDLIGAVLSAPTGTPVDLSLSVFLEHQA